MIELYNVDCMEYLATLEDNAFELAIVDPPYGIGIANKKYTYNTSKKWKNPTAIIEYTKDWDKESPKQEYFNELFRVSKSQIVWGANHFISKMPIDSSCWVIWDKLNGSSNQADFEMAWCSFKTAARKFIYLWDGFKKKKPEKKNHPTQKPVELYEWLLMNYAKEGDRILDTHLGSGSIAIACHNLGFDLVGCELDTDYFNAAKTRLAQHKSQLRIPML
jgi:site-specific DNA-methyltransferase (adenine-specific)